MTDRDRKAQQDALERLINRRELRQRIPASDMTIWRWIRGGIFPTPLKINNRNYWRLGEVLAFMRGATTSDTGEAA
jgi:predicted DNA-binding transcriptional regulator AlpA